VLEYDSLTGCKKWQQWQKYIKSGKKPADIPSNPPAAYKREWKGWGDWLGF
jgi:hypothetical protein